MVVVPHGPRGDADDRGEFSDPHATSEDVDVAARSRDHDRWNCSPFPPRSSGSGLSLAGDRGKGVSTSWAWTRTRRSDRVAKRRCYARGGIPFYLLVDRGTSSTTLFTEPDGDYLRSRTAAFGRSLTLPDPFAFDLDTTDFL
ncbi:Uma2 family endonuclease [Streptomyces collinus]|uniref:Uma2 family endonuclease n=1 Tax=Streptomyces collinus TaxID=42684 RepID=UPI0037FFA47E